MEAWRRALDEPVRAFPIEQAGPAHIATLKTFEPPLSTLDGSRLEETRRGLAADARGRRGGTRAPRTGGTGARRRRARRDPGFRLAAAPLAASRPARDRRQ